jgi:hypothetical protein
MKKRILLVVLLLVSVTISASGNKEELGSIGVEFNKATEYSIVSGTEFKTTLNSVGLYLNSYVFSPEESTGFFSHASFLIPASGKIESMGSSVNYSYSDADLRSNLGYMIGPAYRTSINSNTNLYLGIGPSFYQLIVAEDPFATMTFIFGIGLDAGVHISTANNRFLKLGLLVDYNFANYTYVYTAYGSSSEMTTDYSLTSIRPYIGIGFVR